MDGIINSYQLCNNLEFHQCEPVVLESQSLDSIKNISVERADQIASTETVIPSTENDQLETAVEPVIPEDSKEEMNELSLRILTINGEIESLNQKKRELSKELAKARDSLMERMRVHNIDSIQKNGHQFNLTDMPARKRPAPKVRARRSIELVK
jgi:anaerobic ribonucleoside-triphosphate reductase